MKEMKKIKLTSKIKYIYFMSIYVLLLFFVISQINLQIFNSWICSISWIIVFNLLVNLYFIKKLKISFFSMINFFLIFLYLFHFGQILLMGLIPAYKFSNFNYIKIMNVEILKKTVFICIQFINFFLLGIILLKKEIIIKKNISKQYDNLEKINKLNLLKKVGWTFIIISFPIQIYIDSSNLVSAFLGGYRSTFSSKLPGLIGAIGYFLFTGVGILIIAYKNKKRKSKTIFFGTILYLLGTMLTGNRGHQVVTIIVLIYLYVKLNMNINIKFCYRMLIIAFLGMVFINVIYDMRGHGINYFFNNMNILIVEQIKSNPFLELIESFGETIYTPYLVVQKIDKIIQPTYGKTYIYSLVSILPNIGGAFTNINNSAAFQKMLNVPVIGGSFLGEVFYNFKYIGFFVMIILGGILGRISEKLEISFIKKNYINIIYIIPVFINTLWWVRDSFSYIVRPIIWQWILMYFLIKIFKKRRRKSVR
ncbi:MAG: O-antigen polymerase [Fusobacterium sp. JB019]|nr:O-antigen polymerase [Fusobacterium sp. JB019]